jgi:hypothetical protein
MDSVTILRDLWRLRRAVVIVALLALITGTAVLYKVSFPPNLESRRYDVGLATARILVDTPSSQVVEVAPKGSDSLGVRANLLASLMVDGVVKGAIARRAGLPPKDLVGISEAATEPSPVSKPPTRRDFVLTTRVLTNTGGDQLPIIEIEAQAPNRASAAKLASAAIEGLRDYLDTTAASQQVPDADRLQVTGLGAPQAEVSARGPGPAFAIVVMILVFGLGCGLLLLALTVARKWRAASVIELEIEEEEDPTDDALAREDESDDWAAAQPRPTLLVPRAAAQRSVKREERQAKSL